MFNPIEKPSPEMIKLMAQLEDQKKERSKAVDRLKACAEEITKDVGAETQIFSLPRLGPSVEKAPSTINGESKKKAATRCSVTECREAVKKSKAARSSNLDVLKKTTVRAINGHASKSYDPKELARILEELPIETPAGPAADDKHAS